MKDEPTSIYICTGIRAHTLRARYISKYPYCDEKKGHSLSSAQSIQSLRIVPNEVPDHCRRLAV